MKFLLLLLLLFTTANLHASEQLWRGLVVQKEERCSPYDKKKQYPYPQSVEDAIVESMNGLVYGPYSGNYFNSDTETDIEHIVAASEGHDSGLCGASKALRKEFATDLLNLTLASHEVNRCSATGKCGKDAAEWLPEKNKCWFANRVVKIKTKYKLSVDRAEADALEAVLSNCSSVTMIFFPGNDVANDNNVIGGEVSGDSILDVYDTNGNGRITCSEARLSNIAPVSSEHPAYAYMNDSDGDGIVCE